MQALASNATGEPDQQQENNPHSVEGIQSVLYVLVVCGIILAAVTVAHFVLLLLYARFASSPIPASLQFPHFEVRSSIWDPRSMF
jgi:hypothetical protein